MKHITAILLLVLFFSIPAQNDEAGNSTGGDLAFGQGDNVIAVGLNLDYNSTFAPGVGVLWDHGTFNNMFSMGARVDFSFFGRGMALLPSFRFGFHPFGIPALSGKVKVANVLDPYVVAYAGPRIYTGKWNGRNNTSFGGGLDVGIRWMIKPGFGLIAEGDWNNTLIGVAFRF